MLSNTCSRLPQPMCQHCHLKGIETCSWRQSCYLTIFHRMKVSLQIVDLATAAANRCRAAAAAAEKCRSITIPPIRQIIQSFGRQPPLSIHRHREQRDDQRHHSAESKKQKAVGRHFETDHRAHDTSGCIDPPRLYPAVDLCECDLSHSSDGTLNACGYAIKYGRPMPECGS